MLRYVPTHGDPSLVSCHLSFPFFTPLLPRFGLLSVYAVGRSISVYYGVRNRIEAMHVQSIIYYYCRIVWMYQIHQQSPSLQ